MSFIPMLKNLKRCLDKNMRKDERTILLLCIVIMFVSVAIVAAVVYDSMFMKSSVGIKS